MQHISLLNLLISFSFGTKIIFTRKILKKEDLGILCERHTTSKLTSFEELKDVVTFGFRGEALSSISYVSHLTVTTMTKDQNCAWKAKYFCGKMIPLQPNRPAKTLPCAGNRGTQIVIEDLFFNYPARKLALSNQTEEWKRILTVIERYAIHFSGISINFKRFGSTKSEVCTQQKNSIEMNIRIIYGNDVGKSLEHLSFEDTPLQLKMDCWCTNQNYHAKKFEFLLFINGSYSSYPLKASFTFSFKINRQARFQQIFAEGGEGCLWKDSSKEESSFRLHQSQNELTQS